MTNDTSHAYTYDAEGNITTVDAGTAASYLYNALNQRVQTIVASAPRNIVFNAAGQRVTIWNANTGAQTQGQYYWGGKRVAFYSGGSAHFQHQDWLGTERARTTYNGGVEGTFTSLPFGDGLTTASGTDTDASHFATIDHDYEDETDHAQFRQYSEAQGHWLSPDPYSGSYDPSNPQSMNRYVYVLNNPLSHVDPSGLTLCDYGSNEDGSEEFGDEESDADCAASQGTVVVDIVSVAVNGDNPSDPGVTTENGYQIDPVSVAPNNGPTFKQKNQNCLNKINSTPDGKFYNFFSPLSMIPGIGPDWQGSAAEDLGGGAAKYVAFKFFQGAGANWAGTGLGVIGNTVSGAIEGVAEGVLAPVAAAATVGQLTVHAGCAISAAF
jgi:RHS repeat-associated protein